MTGSGYGSVKRGARVKHPNIGAAATLATLEAMTRAEYRGIPVVPAGAPVYDWRVCGCDYVTLIVGGKPVRQADNPAYQEWGEEEARTTRRKSLAAEVRRLVLLYGLGYFHAKDAFRLFPGHPDCTIWAPGTWVAGVQVAAGRRLVRELKGMATETYGQQLATLTTMRHAGDDVGVWKPCCLLSGRISAELRALAGVSGVHQEDVYGRRAPAGRPATSGPAYPPGSIPADPPPSPARARAKRAAAALAADTAQRPPRPVPLDVLADLTGGAPVTGYETNPVGSVDELTAKTIGRLRAWAVDFGVERVELVWPWRLVVSDTRYWLCVRDHRTAKFRWHEITRLATSPTNVVALVESLPHRTIVADTPQRCMALLAPGVTPATQGEQP